jgi:hypothetical protein
VSVLPENEESVGIPGEARSQEPVGQMGPEQGTHGHQGDDDPRPGAADLGLQDPQGNQATPQDAEGHHDPPGVQEDPVAQGDEGKHTSQFVIVVVSRTAHGGTEPTQPKPGHGTLDGIQSSPTPSPSESSWSGFAT